MAIAPKTPRQARKRLTSGIRNGIGGAALLVVSLGAKFIDPVLLALFVAGLGLSVFGFAEIEAWRRFEDRRDTTEADLAAAHARSPSQGR